MESEQRDIIPAVKNLHPGGAGRRASDSRNNPQAGPFTSDGERGAKQEGWRHHGSDSPKTIPEPTIFMKMDYQEVLRREFHSGVEQELRRGSNFKQSSLVGTLRTV